MVGTVRTDSGTMPVIYACAFRWRCCCMWLFCSLSRFLPEDLADDCRNGALNGALSTLDCLLRSRPRQTSKAQGLPHEFQCGTGDKDTLKEGLVNHPFNPSSSSSSLINDSQMQL